LGFHDVGDGHGHVERDLREVFEARCGLLLRDIQLALDVPPAPEHLREGDESVTQQEHEDEEPRGVADDHDCQEDRIGTGIHHTLTDEDTEEDEKEHQAGKGLESD
jgi:hypothetical protein